MSTHGLPSGWLAEPEAAQSERVLVALSGGVDSSVAAALLVEAGHQVVGVWMRDAADDARRVADQLKIPFHIQNLEREFADAVLEPFVGAYLGGETPSPCVGCNTAVKFGALVGKGSALFGCEAVATGHYARRAVSADGGSWRLRTAVDHDKDQTYFLHGLRSDAIARARFPLGGMTKPEVREVARARGLPTAEKPESQEICFVPDGDYRSLLRTRGWEPQRGEVVDEKGEVVLARRWCSMTVRHLPLVVRSVLTRRCMLEPAPLLIGLTIAVATLAGRLLAIRALLPIAIAAAGVGALLGQLLGERVLGGLIPIGGVAWPAPLVGALIAERLAARIASGWERGRQP